MAMGSDITTQDGQMDDVFSKYRALVPLVSNENILYLNSAFMAPSNLLVHDAFARYAHEALYNPQPKAAWLATVEDTRALVGRYINADPTTISFTRDTTEGLAYFIRSIKFEPGDNVVILDTEHPNQAYGWMTLQSQGLEVRQVPTISEASWTGKVTAANAATFAPYVDERTRAIGLSSIMFHSGQWNDVKDICAVYRPKGIHVLADLTQQVGFTQVDVKDSGVSAAAFSLHKGLNCPTGFGVLYVNQQVLEELNPDPVMITYASVSNRRSDFLVGTGPIEFRKSARRFDHWNQNLSAAAAAKSYLTWYLDTVGPKNLENHLYRLGDVLRRAATELGIRIVGPENRREHAPHLYILDINTPEWVAFFQENGTQISPYRLGIRVSFGFYNDLADVKRFAELLRLGIERGLPLPST